MPTTSLPQKQGQVCPPYYEMDLTMLLNGLHGVIFCSAKHLATIFSLYETYVLQLC